MICFVLKGKVLADETSLNMTRFSYQNQTGVITFVFCLTNRDDKLNVMIGNKYNIYTLSYIFDIIN